MILEEDQVICQGLFTIPGANTSLSQGGKPKTDYQGMLGQKLFEGHEKYKDVFAVTIFLILFCLPMSFHCF